MFPRDNIRITFTVMHNPVFEYSDTLSFAFLACIILYINSKQFRCSVFTFFQYIRTGTIVESGKRLIYKILDCVSVTKMCTNTVCPSICIKKIASVLSRY